MVNNRSITVLLLFLQTSLLANVDSLLSLVPSLSQEEKVEVFNQIGEAYSQQQIFDKAIIYHKDALELSRRTKDKENELAALRGLTRSFLNTKKFEKALEYASNLEELAITLDKRIYLGYAFAYLAQIKSQAMNDTSGARELHFKAIEILKDTDEKKTLAKVYNHTAISYVKEENYDTAIEYYQKGLKIAETFNYFGMIRLFKSNIASVYYQNDNIDLAYQYNQEAFKIIPEKADLNYSVVTYDYLLLNVIQIERGQFDLALENALIGGKLADSLNSHVNLIWSYNSQLVIYNEKEDYKSALGVAQKIISLQDSINQINTVSKLIEKENQIKELRKNKNLLELGKRTQRKLFIRNGVLISIVAALSFFVLLYKRNRLLVKLQKKELDYLNFLKEVEEKEKRILEEKLSHNARALASKSMHIIQKNEVLHDLKNSISNLEGDKDKSKIQSQINKLNRAIDNTINFDDEWKKFRLHFTEIHPQFFENLKQQYPTLSNNDVRLCAYIKMGLSTKEVAQLLGVNATSIQKARYRLKKKMELEKATDLIEFISQNF